jgi:hypothetical protein
MAIKVVGVRQGIFFDKVRFRATKYHDVTFGTLMGDKTFFMEKGNEITLRMSKNDMWKVDDKANGLESLLKMNNQYKFPWFWTEN